MTRATSSIISPDTSPVELRAQVAQGIIPDMHKVLGRFSELFFLLLRLVAGFLFACHGAQKLFGVLGGHKMALMSQMGLAGVIEFFGGVCIAIGLFTPIVAFIASGEMAWAYFQAHFPRNVWPILNQGELAVLYCFLFLFIAARGAGPYSLDRLFGRKM
jgi:putative oxidoreductase